MPSDSTYVGVFCGAAPGEPRIYVKTARSLGAEIARRGMVLVYGGGGAGMMGAVAGGALESGGRVIGVIPDFMVKAEQAHPGVADMRLVDTMAERKNVIIDLADVFIALPGGVGTLDELFEVTSLAQLRFHRKRSGLLDVDGFFDGLLQFLRRAERDRFIRDPEFAIPIVDREPSALLDRLTSGNNPDDS